MSVRDTVAGDEPSVGTEFKRQRKLEPLLPWFTGAATKIEQAKPPENVPEYVTLMLQAVPVKEMREIAIENLLANMRGFKTRGRPWTKRKYCMRVN